LLTRILTLPQIVASVHSADSGGNTCGVGGLSASAPSFLRMDAVTGIVFFVGGLLVAFCALGLLLQARKQNTAKVAGVAVNVVIAGILLVAGLAGALFPAAGSVLAFFFNC
jgi:hypothetical protein